MSENKTYTKAQKIAYAKRMAAMRAQKSKYTPKKTYAKKTYYKKSYNSGVNPSINAAVKAGGGLIGNMIAPGIGGIIGTGLADGAHRLFNGITGYGDYKVKKNTIMTDTVPQFINNGKRRVRVAHREYIADVISGAANSFNIQKYAINPALVGSFPWLANVASQYEEYKIKGMVFEFKTMSADALNSTNTALGQVILATQYNVLSPDFGNKNQMENYEFACSTKPSCSILHAIECEPHETPLTELFTRNASTVVTGSDLRLYDHGNFYIATNGLQAANVNLGELWCSYDIEFYKPKISTMNNLLAEDHWQLAGVSSSAYLGTTQVLRPNATIGSSLTANTLTIPSGYNGYIMMCYWISGSAANTTQMTMTYSGGLSAINAWTGNSIMTVNPASTASTTGYLMNIVLRSQGGGSVTFSGAVVPSGSAGGDLYLIAMPSTV